MPLDKGGKCKAIFDERRNNKGRQEGNFEKFYQELDFMLEEYGKAAEERINKEVVHVPVAISIPQLTKKVCFSVLYLVKVKTCGFF